MCECDALCCKFHDRVLIVAEEIDGLIEMGADLMGENGDMYMNIFPCCKFLKDEKCSIYENRPSGCANYECGEKQREMLIQRSLK